MDEQKLIKDLNLASFSAPVQDKLLGYFYRTLQIRVGRLLGEGLTSAQLAEFKHFIADNNDQAALDWLINSFPNYAELIQSEAAKLVAELKHKNQRLSNEP